MITCTTNLDWSSVAVHWAGVPYLRGLVVVRRGTVPTGVAVTVTLLVLLLLLGVEGPLVTVAVAGVRSSIDGGKRGTFN